MKLTAKQEAFAQEVAKGKRYSEAFRIAYPASRKWKNEAVWVQSSELMDNSKVIVRVDELQRETAERNRVTLDEVLREMAEWLRFDPIELMDDAGAIKPLSQMTAKARKCIADMSVKETFETADGMKIKTGEIKNIKFLDRRGTAEMFMKNFGAYINVNMNVGENGLTDDQKDILGGIKE